MLKSFLATTAIALTLSLSPVRAFAESEPIHVETISPEKLALIDELRVLTNSDENSTQMLDIMMNQMHGIKFLVEFQLQPVLVPCSNII